MIIIKTTQPPPPNKWTNKKANRGKAAQQSRAGLLWLLPRTLCLRDLEVPRWESPAGFRHPACPPRALLLPVMVFVLRLARNFYVCITGRRKAALALSVGCVPSAWGCRPCCFPFCSWLPAASEVGVCVPCFPRWCLVEQISAGKPPRWRSEMLGVRQGWGFVTTALCLLQV